MLDAGMEGGLNESYARLDELLARLDERGGWEDGPMISVQTSHTADLDARDARAPPARCSTTCSTT